MPTKDQVIDILRSVRDPEIGLDIWFLGLIYNVDLKESGIDVEMTFTSPMCPYGPVMVEEIKTKLAGLGDVKNVDVKIVFEPPWEPSDQVKSVLGIL